MEDLVSSSFAMEAPKPWTSPTVNKSIYSNVLYLPIAHHKIKSISMEPINEELIDLLKITNPRLKPLVSISHSYNNSYHGYSNVRTGVYDKLLKMLDFLPENIGITYSEGLRPLWKQKEYFDKKFQEILNAVQDKELAYQETTKHVSPFIDNIPAHATGAAIDITLFEINNGTETLIDMGMFDTIYGHNPQQETFSVNTSQHQRKNRLMLLEAATKSSFINYGFEWWHYSYGDKAWAYVKKQKAIYDLAVEKNDPILFIDKETYLKSF